AKRSAVRRRQRERLAANGETGSPISAAAWEQLRTAVHEEVGRMPEPLRSAFVLCELEGVGQPAAAAALGWKLGTLSGRLSKARQLLLDRLAQRGIPAGPAVAGSVVVGVVAVSAPAAALAKTAALGRCGIDLV